MANKKPGKAGKGKGSKSGGKKAPHPGNTQVRAGAVLKLPLASPCLQPLTAPGAPAQEKDAVKDPKCDRARREEYEKILAQIDGFGQRELGEMLLKYGVKVR